MEARKILEAIPADDPQYEKAQMYGLPSLESLHDGYKGYLRLQSLTRSACCTVVLYATLVSLLANYKGREFSDSPLGFPALLP
jgi:hypothetical protein